MTCGIDLNIASLDVLKDALDSEIQGLISAAGGLGTNIDAIKALATTQMSVIVSELTAALPDLAGLIPSSTLISDMTGLLGLISNPAAFALQAASIASKYGAVPGVDIAGLASSILSGNIGLDSICSLIPNVQIDALNNVIKKGIIPLPPTAAVEKLPDLFAGLSQASAALASGNALNALASVVADTTERLDGTIIKVLASDVSNATAPGGIMAVLGNQLQTLSGKPIPDSIQKAFEGMPAAAAAMSESANLEEKLFEMQSIIKAEMPEIKNLMNNAGTSVPDTLGEMAGILNGAILASGLPGSENAQEDMKAALTEFNKIFASA